MSNRFHDREWRAALASAILLSSLCSIGCQRTKTEASAGPSGPPPAVVVARVQQKTVPIYGEFVGQIQAAASADIVARVQGVLKEIRFEEGQPVRKGQILYVIDPVEYQAKVDSARAAVAKSESVLKQAKEQTRLLQAKADLEQQKALLAKAQKDVERAKPLAAQRAIAQQDLDGAMASAAVNRANVEASEARLQNEKVNTPAAIEQGTADLANSKAALTQAELNLSYCTIVAPFDGLIGRTRMFPGALVGAGSAAVLNTLYAIDPVLVTFGIPETGYLTVRRRNAGANGPSSQAQALAADLILADNTTYPFKGRFKLADSAIDQKTGTLTIVLSFPNPQGLLRPNGFGRVRLMIGNAEDALLIPQKAAIEQQGGTAVLIVGEDGKVSQRSVVLGPQFENLVIVKQGLKAGERVVTEGQQKARPGSSVSPTETAITSETKGK